MTTPLDVLIVEDSADDAALTLEHLRRAGFEPAARIVETEAQYRAALDAAPELILCDYRLPHFNGESALRLVRQTHPEIPVIMVTGTLGDEKAVELLKLGAKDYVLKDRLARLAPAITRALAEERGIRNRKAAEKAVQENEARFRTIFEQAAVGISQSSADGRYLRVNDKLCAIMGHAREELIGRSFLEFTHPEDAARDLTHLQEFHDGEISNYTTEKRYRRKDCAIVWCRVTVAPVLDAAGKLDNFITVVEDITARKQAETMKAAELSRVQRQMKAIGTLSMSEALLSGDVGRLAREITEKACYVAGVERANVWLFNEDESELRCIDLFEATPGRHSKGAVLRQDQFENEFRALKNVSYVDADDAVTDPRTAGYVEGYLKPLRITSMLDAVVQISGKHLGLLCLEHVDKPHHWERDEVTFACQLADKLALAMTNHRRQQAQADQLESEQRYRVMIEQSISGFYLIRNGRFGYVNARFAEIFGYPSAGEIIGKTPLELVAERDRLTVTENIRRRLAGEVRSVTYSFTGVRRDGTEIEVDVHGALAVDKGEPVIIGLLQDISERKRAEKEIQRYIARLEQAMRSTIGVVTAIGEARDPYTRGHERRVGEIAAAIAIEMGLDANRVEGVRVAGYMHDVGKISVPAEILSKPGKLTKAEYELVKGHAEQSYQILKGVDFPWPVAEAAWQHHERLDGSGYPRGLRGEAIILEARVLGVADTVEAMSSHRPYRPALGIEKALAEIEEGRGTRYEPEVVDACLRLFRGKGFAPDKL